MTLLSDIIAKVLGREAESKPEEYNFYRDVAKMMDCAGQGRGKFDARQYCLYLGLQFEELHEKAVRVLGPSAEHEYFLSVMKMYAGFLRGGIYTKEVQAAFNRDPEGLLDDDVDQLVVTYGAMESSGANIQGALKAVTDANLAKFPGGKAIIDANGKIVKPEGWTSPDLSPFVYKGE